jgi:exodeoxyribonuclease VII large subunit
MDGADRAGSSGRHGPPDGAWTVAELNRAIENVLSDGDDRFPDYVVGEVAEVDQYGFGSFFELRDLDTDCVISCLIWDGTRSALAHDIEPGDKGVVGAAVDFYAEQGACQLLVSEYWPLGESERQQELEALRAELTRDDVFDDERKQPIPQQPGCVGLVTSPSGSAREDTWTAINERSPRTDVRLCGAPVQGADAVGPLIESVQRLDSRPDVEAIILTRGGGSDVDLWCFNAEPLVRAIADCSTPVVAAIGHEDDETLVESAADTRAMTPTEAGVTVTTLVEDTAEELDALQRRIDTSYRALVTETLEQIERQVATAYETVTRRAQQKRSLHQRAHNVERRVTVAYQTLVETRLDALDSRIDDGVRDIELEAESAAAEHQAAVQRLTDLESRIDTAYRAHTVRQLDGLETRIEAAHRELETEKRIAASAAETRRLRLVVAGLVALILLGAVGVGLGALP